MNQLCLILAAICFFVGAVPQLASIANINWTNAGLGFVVLAMILG